MDIATSLAATGVAIFGLWPSSTNAANYSYTLASTEHQIGELGDLSGATLLGQASL